MTFETLILTEVLAIKSVKSVGFMVEIISFMKKLLNCPWDS